jgi:hypothetical protein
MLVTCGSVKGGSGTTVVATALASLLARRCPSGCVLVDVGGDVGAAVGLTDAGGAGVTEWWAAADVGGDALLRLALEAGRGLRLFPRGAGVSPAPAGAGEQLVAALEEGGAGGAAVVIDAGPASATAFELAAAATVSLLVLRPCYLALRRALTAPVRPSAVVLVDEPGRALHAGDVEDVLGVPVRAIVPWDAGIARSVDAGLLTARLPRALAAALRAAA